MSVASADLPTSTRRPSTGEIAAPSAIVAVFVILYLSPTSAVSALGVAALIAIAAWRPSLAVATVPATLAIINVMVQVGHLEFSPTEILLVATLAGVGTRGAVVLARERLEPLVPGVRGLVDLARTGIGPVSLALVAVGTLSLFTVADPTYRHESLRWYRWVILEPVAFTFLARWYLEHRRERLVSAALYVAAASAASLWALIALAHGGGLAVQGVVRISGTYPQPNALALYLERPIPFVVAMGLAFRRRLRWEWLVAAAVCGAALLLTFSRGAWIGAGLAVLVVLWLGGRRRLATGFASLEAAAGLGLALVDGRRVLNLFHGGSGSLRIDIWSSAIAMIRDHAVFGVGLDQFLYQYAPRYVRPEAWSERFTSHPHDIVLDVWLSLGIMGLIVAAFTVAVAIVQTRRAIALHHRLALAAAGALLAGGIHGLVDNGYFLPDLALALWFFMVIIDLESRKPPELAAAIADDEGG